METEILALGAVSGVALGEVIDYAAARISVAQSENQPDTDLSRFQRFTKFVLRRMSLDKSPPVPEWSTEDEIDAPEVAEIPTQPDAQLSRTRRVAGYIGRRTTFLAVDGLAFGLSVAAAISSPASASLVNSSKADIGIAFDASGQAANGYGNGFAMNTEQTYYKSILDDPKLRTYSILSQQNGSGPTTPNFILGTSPLGGSDLDGAVTGALPRDKAVVLITSGGELTDLTNDENAANADKEHVFVIDIEQGDDPELQALASATGGQYYNAGTYSPSSIDKALNNIELPTQRETSLLFSSDESMWITMSCVTFAGLAVGAFRRSEYIIQWRFNKNNKGDK